MRWSRSRPPASRRFSSCARGAGTSIRPPGGHGGGRCALVPQTALEYEGRWWGRAFGRVVLAGATQGPAGVAGADGARHALEDRLRVPVEAAAFSDLASLSDRSPGS